MDSTVSSVSHWYNRYSIHQWFPNCGTRTTNCMWRPSRYANRPTFGFIHKKYIYSYYFYSVDSCYKLLNFCVPCWFLKMAVIISLIHFVPVAFVLILVFQTFDRMFFGRLSFPGTSWYVVTVRDPQMVTLSKVWEPLLHTNDIDAFLQLKCGR